ncbi:unnamed protein product [marine sediment metagenome]|uniref:DUF7352 domain-containing protein n=1 Tax=marine sediment metagenome TaxID=412755 RepID=X1G8E8_9ZZZZ
MKTIFKYPLRPDDYQIVIMPRGAQILTVQAQRERPCLWALVETDNEPEERHFRMAGTGHLFTSKDKLLRYIGTFQVKAGELVFHVFEIEGARNE